MAAGQGSNPVVAHHRLSWGGHVRLTVLVPGSTMAAHLLRPFRSGLRCTRHAQPPRHVHESRGGGRAQAQDCAAKRRFRSLQAQACDRESVLQHLSHCRVSFMFRPLYTLQLGQNIPPFKAPSRPSIANGATSAFPSLITTASISTTVSEVETTGERSK